MHYEDDLIITADNASEYTQLESINGYLEVHADFQAPQLTSVSRSIYVNADFQAPQLASVGESLCVNADFQAPQLTSVGRYLEVHADFQAPQLASVGESLYVHADFQAPQLASVGGYLEVYADFQAPQLKLVEDEPITYYKYLLNLNWPVLVTDKYIRIGCQCHTKEAWVAFADEEITRMDKRALAFWREHKEQILAL